MAALQTPRSFKNITVQVLTPDQSNQNLVVGPWPQMVYSSQMILRSIGLRTIDLVCCQWCEVDKREKQKVEMLY